MWRFPPFQEQSRALAGLAFPFAVGTKHDPAKFHVGVATNQLKDRAPTTDLDVIGVRSQAEHFEARAAIRDQWQPVHGWCGEKARSDSEAGPWVALTNCRFDSCLENLLAAWGLRRDPA